MLTKSQSGPVLSVILNRPEVRNAFNEELIAELFTTFTTLAPDVRAVVLSGTGPAFCAGGDLGWMRRAAENTFQDNYEDALKLAQLLEAISTCSATVIALVHGAAFGGGSGLVAAADLAIAADDSKFAFSEVRLGLIPATIARHVIPKIGAGAARALFMTGEIFSAERAFQLGLVHQVVSADNLEQALGERIKATLKVGPQAVLAARRLTQFTDLTVQQSAEMLAQARSGEEGREGVSAFLNKRSPTFAEEAS